MKLLQAIYNRIPLIRLLIRRSKNWILPGFEGVPFYDVILFFIQQVNRVGLNERAAAISFSFIMAIPPASIFVFTLVPLLPIADLFQQEVMSFVNDLTPNRATRKLMQDFLTDLFQRPRNSLLSVGFLLAMFYSSNAVMGMIHTFNRSINEKDSKKFFEDRWKAIKLTFIIILLFVGSMIILITQGVVFKWVMEWLNIQSTGTKWLILIFRWIVILTLFFYCIAFIYRHAPSVERKWKLISPGSILASISIILFTYVFSFWVNNFGTYNKVYGSIGTIMVLMIIIYINSLVLLIGFELNVSIKSLRRRADKRLLNEMIKKENNITSY